MKLNKNLLLIAVVSTGLCVSELSTAATPSYSYVAIDFVEREIETIDVNANIGPFSPYLTRDTTFDGFSFSGSLEINDNWFLEAHRASLKLNEALSTTHVSHLSIIGSGVLTSVHIVKANTSIFSGAIGYKFYEGEASNAFVALGYTDIDLDITIQDGSTFISAAGAVFLGSSSFTRVSVSDFGTVVSAGYRINLSKAIQLGLRLDHLNVEESTTKSSVDLLYDISNNFTLQLNAAIATNETQYGFGARYHF